MRPLACWIGRHEWTSRVEQGETTRCARGAATSLGGGVARRGTGARTTKGVIPAVARAAVATATARPL
jgi:hypothetical protein